jgi:FkbM family methyltransferase
VYEKLDRPGARGVVGAVATVHISLRQRRPCLITPTREGWIHRCGGTGVVKPAIGETTPQRIEEETFADFLYEYVPGRGEIVIDVGAGYGRETITFSRLVGPEGRVLAVEAHPRIFRCLARTVTLNRLTNVSLAPVAISSESGSELITDRDDDATNTLIREPTEPAIRVATTSLDGLTSEHDLGVIDFLKVNIEGAEARALSGMQDTLRRTRHLAIACHDFLAVQRDDDGLRTFEPVRRVLRGMGFELVVREDHPQPWTKCTLYGANQRLADT